MLKLLWDYYPIQTIFISAGVLACGLAAMFVVYQFVLYEEREDDTLC